jgi:hypothetical protein
MPIGLDQRCLERLRDGLAELIPEFKVRNGWSLDRSSIAGLLDLERALPNSDRVAGLLESFVNETPFFDFVYGELSRELYELEEYSSEPEFVRLIDIPRYSAPQELSERLVSGFEALPRRYKFTIRLNPDLLKYFTVGELDLTESIRLVRVDAEFINQYPLESGIPRRDNEFQGGILGFGVPDRWSEDCLYIQIDSSGYVGKWTSTTPEDSSISVLKSIIGTCLAIRALKKKNIFSLSTIKQKAYVHEFIDGRWQLYDSLELDDALSNVLLELAVETLDGVLGTEEEIKGFFAGRLRLLKKVWTDQAINERILLAGKWLFDSYSGKNELLSFVQATVALEILLGDKAVSDVIGLGELLRNRCAYLIGKTHAQRKEILDDFGKIYEIRSKIVHRGKDRLRRNERELLYTLRWLVSRVIQEELERAEGQKA